MTSEIKEESKNKRSHDQERIVNLIKDDVDGIRMHQTENFSLLTFDQQSTDKLVDGIINKVTELRKAKNKEEEDF